ncbi:MAG TPA: hypothetical protein VNA16_01415, partial [Abditibacteriaceae bacterium]|nr:hypothetical protein [Abditibacteriaceae bacterium]
PKEPRFAWQINDILSHFGLKYIFDPARHDQGVRHTAMPLLKKYLPNAPAIKRRLAGMWVVPFKVGGGPGESYPLVRSQRLDGMDVPPQLFVVRNAMRTAIVSFSPLFTGGDIVGAGVGLTAEDAKLWPLERETVVALARLAGDLRRGKVHLTPEMKVEVRADLPPPEPLRTLLPTGSVNPEGAKAEVRWGKFDGASWELGEPLAAGHWEGLLVGGADKEFPRALQPGAILKLVLPKWGQGARYLRIRGGFAASGAGLCATLGETTVWNETFVYVDTGGPGNYGATEVGNLPATFTRIVYLPPDAGAARVLTLSNPGTQPVYFDAVQIESRTKPNPAEVLGLMLIDVGGKPNVPVELSRQWSLVRGDARINRVGPPGDPRRFDIADELFARFVATGAPIHLVLMGTPEWAAISPERFAEGKRFGRAHVVPPELQKYAEIVEQIVRRHGDQIDVYEIWNEPDIEQFFRGTAAEYAQLFHTLAPLIRRLDPTAKIVSAGMAGYKESFVEAMVQHGVFAASDWIGFHPYAGRSPAWDVPYGQLESKLYSMGLDLEIYNDEMGFTWKPGEWFQGDYTPLVQRDLLDRALGRLMANGVTRLNLFDAGGLDHHFGLIDAKGAPLPAYAVVQDYLLLAQKGGRRLDVSLTGADAKPLRGVYVAAAAHADGSTTIVVNPAESAGTAAVVLRIPLAKKRVLRGSVKVGDATTALAVPVQAANGQAWAEVRFNLAARSVLRLLP